jgi:hypothetical protein
MTSKPKQLERVPGARLFYFPRSTWIVPEREMLERLFAGMREWAESTETPTQVKLSLSEIDSQLYMVEQEGWKVEWVVAESMVDLHPDRSQPAVIAGRPQRMPGRR